MQNLAVPKLIHYEMALFSQLLHNYNIRSRMNVICQQAKIDWNALFDDKRLTRLVFFFKKTTNLIILMESTNILCLGNVYLIFEGVLGSLLTFLNIISCFSSVFSFGGFSFVSWRHRIMLKLTSAHFENPNERVKIYLHFQRSMTYLVNILVSGLLMRLQ